VKINRAETPERRFLRMSRNPCHRSNYIGENK
jgi:hypothetical protein